MTDRELVHPHDLLVRYFLVEPDLMADLLVNYVDSGIVSLLDLSALRCESPVHSDLTM
ncbi:Rpn family recombination-promoting nuclease/putative transposase [Desulfosarcina sp. OttesenSCG-928-B08]|nr:Rpn family recombination-promoting nuclease/putative transposase [Desulfosarcina sp. OttesenSCG-928-B08]